MKFGICEVIAETINLIVLANLTAYNNSTEYNNLKFLDDIFCNSIAS